MKCYWRKSTVWPPKNSIFLRQNTGITSLWEDLEAKLSGPDGYLRPVQFLDHLTVIISFPGQTFAYSMSYIFGKLWHSAIIWPIRYHINASYKASDFCWQIRLYFLEHLTMSHIRPYQKKLQHIFFRKLRGGAEGCLEFLREFIRFGAAILL